ncbi:hypothetical protein [Kribbella solani]|uniref:Uncharacterized protein n=1 Tax=Kribbella solani TaxID=236067 RepID=A0A841DUY9_9ACTN|nr:hypothetical protein [Kribbella solani]MBB5981909.1 hypothetical protein [Kribbella solani]
MPDGRQESGDDGQTRYEQKQFEAGLGGTRSDPKGTPVESGWLSDPKKTLDGDSHGAKKQTGSRTRDSGGRRGTQR